MRRFNLMGIRCRLGKNRDSKRWTMYCSLQDRELFNKYVYQTFGDDILRFWQNKVSVCAETRFTDLNEFFKKLRKPKPVEI